MKKLLFLAAFIAALTLGLSSTVQAQSSHTVPKSITGADTISWPSMPSKLMGFQYTYTETGSVTTAGKVYLEGTINGTWVLLDSLTLADVTTPQTKVFPVAASTGTTYKGYRFRTTNTTTADVVAAYLRRYDDR